MNFPLRDVMPPLFQPDLSGNTWARLVTCQVIAAIRNVQAHDIAAAQWPSDRVLIDVLTRAASTQAQVGLAGWAAELTHRVVADALKVLGPASAAAQIFEHALTLAFTGPELLSVPGLVAGAGYASFVGEGQPIPVRQLPTTPALINPYKVATIAVLTREMINGSNAQALITDALVRSVGAALDTVLFDANPADTTRPAGLRNGIAALTPSAATDPFEAVFEDISQLIDAIAPVGGAGPYVVVASPGRAAGMRQRFTNYEADPAVYASSAAGANVYAIAPAALAAALSPTPDIETATAAALVMDSAPGQMGGTQTEKQMFQTDSVALKVRWPISWVLRDARGFAWVTPTWK